MNAFAAAEKNGKAAELQNELDTPFTAQNKRSDPNFYSRDISPGHRRGLTHAERFCHVVAPCEERKP
jgi:hypothetical protein